MERKAAKEGGDRAEKEAPVTVSNELPWLQIVACQWKEVVMGEGGVPAQAM